MTPTAELENEGLDAIQAHPEEADQQSPYGERNEELPEQLVNVLRAIVIDFQKQEKFDRRREILRDRKNRFYERGFQHIWIDNRTSGFSLTTPGGVYTSSTGSQMQAPNYVDDYNIFQPYLRIIESILTQNPPGIIFRPKDPSRAEDMDAASNAENYRFRFKQTNNVKALQTRVVRMMALGGRAITWTRTEADAQKFGTNPDGSAKRAEITSVYGTLESKLMITAKELKDTPYVFLYDDPHIKMAKADYPTFAKKLKANETGLGEQSYERLARVGALQGMRGQTQVGESLVNLTTRMNCFLRPAAYCDGEGCKEPFEDTQPGEESMTVGEKLQELFPSGCQCFFVGDTYVGSWDQCLDDAVALGRPYEQDGMFQLAIMDPVVVVQDRFNDNMNAAAEVWDHGWPSTWINADDDEYDAISDQKADPYAIRQKKVRTGLPMQQEFFREPDPVLPETFVQFNDQLQGPLAQFMLATPPALFGAAMADQKTASGYAQARAQAMGQLGLIWGQMQWMFACINYQAALSAAGNSDNGEQMSVPGEGSQIVQINLAKLSKNNFGCYPDEDSSFPESTDAKRATLQTIFTAAETNITVGQQIMSAPDNWETFNEILGLPELVIPEAESRNKQAAEIEQLLQESPLPPDPQMVQESMVQHAAATIAAEHMGQPPPPIPSPESLLEPSVPVDELDFHEYEFLKCKDYLSSASARQQRSAGNTQGLLNVKLHALAHQKMMIAQMPPPLPVAGAPPAPGAKPKPPAAPPSKDQPPGSPGQPTA